MSSDAKPKLMVIDDNPQQHLLIDEAFQSIGHLDVEIGHIGGGPEALAELRHLSHHPELPKPSVILVDLNMPAVDGLEVIAYVKSHEALRDIKTVVLSTSNSASDRLLSRNAGADGYLVKPDAFSEWCELMERVAEEHRVPGPGA